MKKLLISSIVFLMIIGTASRSNAQASVNVNINLQPDWGPVGYDYVEYYYLPAYEIYYFVPRRQFVYFDGGQWIFVSTLPPRYKDVNLYSTYKVVINEPKAYTHFDAHKVKYAKHKGGAERQEIIRDSKDPKYKDAKRHPEPQRNDDKKKEDRDKRPDEKQQSNSNNPK